MKNIILSLLIAICLSCKQNNTSKINTSYINKNATLSHSIFKDLNEIQEPFCLKIDTLPKSNYYQVDIDTFLSNHNLTKSTNELINNKFHKRTQDFISKTENYFVNYPFNGNAYAIKKMIINKNVTAIFYTYLFNSEIIQPRIEIQTFNKKNENIDNLIIASTFSSECNGYRDFCIEKNKIKIVDYYFCYEGNQEHENEYNFEINNDGKFLKINK